MKNTSLIVFCLFCSVLSWTLRAQNVIRVGIIGLDTSHSPAFVELLNSDNPKPEHQGFRVVAAYPYGSQTIENSYKRIPIYTERVKKYGVEIVSSIAELLDKVDCVLLETNDGNLHFEQAKEVLKSKKPMFIDKPVAANLVDAIAIFKLAELYNVPIFSSSALRFVPQNIAHIDCPGLRIAETTFEQFRSLWKSPFQADKFYRGKTYCSVYSHYSCQYAARIVFAYKLQRRSSFV